MGKIHNYKENRDKQLKFPDARMQSLLKDDVDIKLGAAAALPLRITEN